MSFCRVSSGLENLESRRICNKLEKLGIVREFLEYIWEFCEQCISSETLADAI